MIQQREIAKLFAAALARSERREGWPSVKRDFECVVDGVACNLHVRAQMQWQRRTRPFRVAGECFVFVSNASDAGLVGGSGVATFGISQRGIESAWRLYEIALADALAELRAAPEFQALADKAAIGEDVPAPQALPAQRPRFRL